MDWNKNVKPSANICPQIYSFTWNKENNRCRRTVGLCKREDSINSRKDFYEPCEPELEKANLPWFYFIPNEETLADEVKAEYLRKSADFWKL